MRITAPPLLASACHCARCLSWMFTRPAGMDAFVNVRASVLDDHAWFAPYVEFWTSEKLPWATTPSKRSYAREPEFAEFETLLRGYAQEGARPR